MPQPTRTRLAMRHPLQLWHGWHKDLSGSGASGLHRLGGHSAWGRSPFRCGPGVPRGSRTTSARMVGSGGAGLILRGDHLLGEDLASLVEDGLPCGLWCPHRDADAPVILTVPLLTRLVTCPRRIPRRSASRSVPKALRQESAVEHKVTDGITVQAHWKLPLLQADRRLRKAVSRWKIRDLRCAHARSRGFLAPH